MALKSVIRFVCCWVLTTFALSVGNGCGLKRISTIVDYGYNRSRSYPCGFRRESEKLPAFLLLLVVFLKLLFCDEFVYIIVLVDKERVCLLYVVLLAVV